MSVGGLTLVLLVDGRGVGINQRSHCSRNHHFFKGREEMK